MIKQNLDRLQSVDLRNVWDDEARDFTPWLAEEENLRQLSDTLGLDLELHSQEQAVGPFSADILCKAIPEDSWVLIENQLERTDHKHLGQLLTYAAGLEAVNIVWVAKRFTDEHRAALDWLNEMSTTDIRFFGLEIELWRIGDSHIAPKFNIVSAPNDWSKTFKAQPADQSVSGLKLTQLRFWQAFNNYLSNKDSIIPCRNPRSNQSLVHPFKLPKGIACLSYISTFTTDNSWENNVRVEIHLNGQDSKTIYDALFERKDDLETEYGESLIWYSIDDVQRCRIILSTLIDFEDENTWEECFQWLENHIERFQQVFFPAIERIV